MAEFPSGIFTPRETENLPGLVYDVNDKRNLYSEDFQNLGLEIKAIEETLGVGVNGEYETVLAWLTALTEGGGGGAEWFVGSGVPDDGTGTNGDLYLRTSNGDVYQKSAGTWGSPVANIKGPTGATGSTGATGAQGDAGPGVASGGTTGQKLVKASNDDYDTEWVDDSGGSVPEDVAKVATVTLSTSDITGMYATPVEILPAPGSGKIILIEQILMKFIYGGTQFQNGGGMVIKTATTTFIGNGPLSQSNINGAVNIMRFDSSDFLGSVITRVENENVVATNIGSAFTTGNGSIKLYIKYRIVTL